MKAENTLIAEFLKVDKNQDLTFEFPQFGYLKLNGDFKTEFNANELKFHKSWDWLMLAVKKIMSTGIAGEFIADIKDGFTTCDIEKTFYGVVNFIEWYNHNY